MARSISAQVVTASTFTRPSASRKRTCRSKRAPLGRSGTQVSAVTKALHAVSLGLVEEHIGHCVVGAASEPDPAARAEAIDAKVKEAADAIGRLLR